MDAREENPPEQINQEVPQPVRRSTQHATPIHRLEPTMIGETYHNNNVITQTIEENEHTIEYKK